LLAIAWFTPNTRQIMARAEAFIVDRGAPERPIALRWQVNRRWAVASALLLVTSLISMSRVSEFLYFQF
jgi:alginate O-acetyltransferase complex protein AlgI